MKQAQDLAYQSVDLEELDTDVYCARHQNLWFPVTKVYGGQLVGCAVAAARRTVASGIAVHSLHAYFVDAAGDQARDLVCFVVDGHNVAMRACQ